MSEVRIENMLTLGRGMRNKRAEKPMLDSLPRGEEEDEDEDEDEDEEKDCEEV